MMINQKYFIPILFLVIVEITSHLLIAKVPVGSEPPNPPDQGSPTGREPAAPRGPCEKTSLPFTPLLPPPDDGFSGLTLKAHPTFWFYVPYKADSISGGRFVLREKEGNKRIHRVSFKLPKTPGFVSVSIPNTASPLEKNKQYIWTLVLDCGSGSSDQPPTVSHEGLVQRVELANLEIQLKTTKLEELIKFYVKKEIWYDAPSDLAKIREFPDAWVKLLEAAGLEELKQESIGGEVAPIEKQ
ncbi:MAG: DUF928 domain-containing protein [Potamolinea sp.]